MAELECEVEAVTVLTCAYENYMEQMKVALPRTRMGLIPASFFSTELRMALLSTMKIGNVSYDKILHRIHTRRSNRSMIMAVEGTDDVPVYVIGLRFKTEDEFERALDIVTWPSSSGIANEKSDSTDDSSKTLPQEGNITKAEAQLQGSKIKSSHVTFSNEHDDDVSKSSSLFSGANSFFTSLFKSKKKDNDEDKSESQYHVAPPGGSIRNENKSVKPAHNRSSSDEYSISQEETYKGDDSW